MFKYPDKFVLARRTGQNPLQRQNRYVLTKVMLNIFIVIQNSNNNISTMVISVLMEVDFSNFCIRISSKF